MPKITMRRKFPVGRKVYGYSGSGARYIGKVKRTEFIKAVADIDRASENWVRERVSPTGNREELKKAKRRPGRIIRVRR